MNCNLPFGFKTHRIESRANKEFKRLISLHKKKGREKEGLFLVESFKLVEELLSSAYALEMLIYDHDKYELDLVYQGRVDLLLSMAGQKAATALSLSSSLFQTLSTLETPEGMMALAKKPASEMETSKNVLLLDRIQDPGNLGTMIRSAEAFGFHSVYTVQSVDFFNPKVLRASMGSAFRLDLREVDEDAIIALKGQGFTFYGTDMSGMNYLDVQVGQKNVLVIGNEGQGMTAGMRAQCDQMLSIPMQGKVESLNAAISAAVLMSQLGRT